MDKQWNLNYNGDPDEFQIIKKKFASGLQIKKI